MGTELELKTTLLVCSWMYSQHPNSPVDAGKGHPDSLKNQACHPEGHRKTSLTKSSDKRGRLGLVGMAVPNETAHGNSALHLRKCTNLI